MNQLSLFGEESRQTTAAHAVLVRSHLRRVKGIEPAPATLPSPAAVRPTAPHNGTTTSRAAAAHVLATGQAATQLAQVLSLIEQAGQEGATRGEIAQALGLPTSTICARVDTLRKAGRVQEDGRTRIPKCGGAVRQRVLVGVGI